MCTNRIATTLLTIDTNNYTILPIYLTNQTTASQTCLYDSLHHLGARQLAVCLHLPELRHLQGQVPHRADQYGRYDKQGNKETHLHGVTVIRPRRGACSA